MSDKISRILIMLCVAAAITAAAGCTRSSDGATVPTTAHDAEEQLAQQIMHTMTFSDMVYQMMYVTPESVTGVSRVTAAGETTRLALQRHPVGGIVYFAANLTGREQTSDMIRNTQQYSAIPLFIGVDEEGGRVARLGQNPAMGTTHLPAMGSIGDTGDVKAAYAAGETLAWELRELGFNMDFAPVADVLVNHDNREIGDRSFGSNPELAAAMVGNLVDGMQSNGVSATLKHFPGHGSTYTDSHTGYSQSERTPEQLRSVEFLPFKAGIEKGAGFVMVSHMTLVNATEEKVPSSVSKEVITDMLIEELGYNGIVITDSFSMGAITDKYAPGEAAVKAVQAGADMILMTPNLAEAHGALVMAVESGEIPAERIQNSVRKILLRKIKMGLLE